MLQAPVCARLSHSRGNGTPAAWHGCPQRPRRASCAVDTRVGIVLESFEERDDPRNPGVGESLSLYQCAQVLGFLRPAWVRGGVCTYPWRGPGAFWGPWLPIQARHATRLPRDRQPVTPRFSGAAPAGPSSCRGTAHFRAEPGALRGSGVTSGQSTVGPAPPHRRRDRLDRRCL